MNDSNIRSLIKTISWRLTGSSSTFLISYFLLGNIFVAGSISLIQLFANTILYFIHERIWNTIKWNGNV